MSNADERSLEEQLAELGGKLGEAIIEQRQAHRARAEAEKRAADADLAARRAEMEVEKVIWAEAQRVAVEAHPELAPPTPPSDANGASD